MNAPEPPPIANDKPAVWDLVIADVTTDNNSGNPRLHRLMIHALVVDMRERNRIGTEKYGTPLQADNGRDALVDAYQEALDLCAYLRQCVAEGKIRLWETYWEALGIAATLRRLIARGTQ